MVEVFLLIGGSSQYLTQVWVSEHALQQIKSECEDPRACIQKLVGFAQAGFWRLEGEENSIIRHEVGHTYRVRYKGKTLFRIVGFYETPQKRDFIVLDAFTKPGNDYTAAQRARMQKISQIKERNEWKRSKNPEA